MISKHKTKQKEITVTAKTRSKTVKHPISLLGTVQVVVVVGEFVPVVRFALKAILGHPAREDGLRVPRLVRHDAAFGAVYP
jgi:hypothetical protein